MPISERTPLRASPDPTPAYMFMPNPTRVYRSRIRQFQCCVCASVLAAFVVALVVTVSYSVQDDNADNENSSTVALNTLLALQYPLPDTIETKWPTDPTPEQMEQALEAAETSVKQRDIVEISGPHLMPNTPAYRHQKGAIRTSPAATKLARAGYMLVVATQNLVKNGLGRPIGSKSPIGNGPTMDAAWMPKEVCSSGTGPCSNSPYRTLDGTCNNRLHAFEWGTAMRTFRRILPPEYSDGVSIPRVAVDGGPLPSARQISVQIHRPMYHDDPDFSVMLAVWGQFLDHDLTATALTLGTDGQAMACCGPGPKHPECFPVSLAAGDPYYHQFNLTCMEFVRSVAAPTCKLGPRQQLNQMTSFIDASVIYGPNFELSQKLRSFAGGRLKMTLSPDGRELLPFSDDPKDGCNRDLEMARGRYCFMAGDARANENLHLTSMHLIWARQHNLVAGKLAVLNPTWDDEKTYQETRRIVSAQMQHVTYSEFLPIILGENLMTKMELSPKADGYDHSYNPSVDATIANSFAASTFRFAHTLLPGLMRMLRNADNTSEEFVELHRMLFNPYSLYSPNGVDNALNGAMVTPIQQVAPHVSKELTDHLFEEGTPKPPVQGGPPAPCGLDLVSLNIQRGRDHGLPSYPYWREKCGLSRPETFDDLQEYMDPDSVTRILSMYKSVEDIDMYTGMLSEVPITGGFLGPTVTCLITDQFLRLKQGDRFWYETSEQPQAFTLEQLAEIRKTSLAQIICDNSDGVDRASPQVMRSVSSPGNMRVPCEALPHPNYAFWKQSPSTGEFIHPGIYHVMLASSDTVARAPVKLPFIPIKLGANVTSGSIVTDAGTVLWSGTLPVAIPSLSMDSKPLLAAGLQLPFFPIPAYGMIWEGTLSGSAIQGRFSLPQFIHGGAGMLSQKFLNGKFSFNLVVSWNIPGGSSVDVSGIYSSTLKLSDSPNFGYMKTRPTPISLPDVSAEYSDTPSVAFSGILRKAPVVLLGTYSLDKTVFWWDGSVTLTIPPSSYGTQWAENNGVQPERMSPMLSTMVENKYSEDKVGEATDIFAKTLPLRFGASVISGNISAVMPSNETLDLTFPLAIPIPAPEVEVGKTTSPSIDIIWRGVLTATSPDNASMTGIFSYSKDSAMSSWINGYFDFQIKMAWNATMQPVLSANGTFTSSIYFKEKKGYIPPAGLKEPAVDWSEFESNTTEITTPATQNAILILEGNFTQDKSHFIWPGSFSFVILNAPVYSGKEKDWKTKKASPNMWMQFAKSPSSKEQFGVAVTGGSLSPSDANAAPWWSGVLPVTFAAPPKGAPAPLVHWKGTLTSTGLTGNLHGTFSFPYLAVKGNFSLDARFLWSTTFTAMVDPNVEYTAAIFFQEVKTTEDSTTKMLEQIITEADSAGMANKIVIVLQGLFSPDSTMFTWYGNAFVNFPVLPTSPMTLNSPPEKSLMDSDFLMSSFNSITIGATVVSGKVTASSKDGTNVTLFNASPPATFTLPLFLYDIMWNGTISSSGILKGSFSKNISIFNVISWSGDFEFQITQLWNTSIATMAMADLIDSNNQYSVSIYTQAMKPKAEDVAGGYVDSDTLQLIMKDVMANKVVVILQGALSPDKTTFTWMGNVIIRFPLATLMMPKPNPAMLKSTMPTNKKEMLLAPKYSTTLEAMVVSGTVTASKSTGGSMVTVFSGYPPTTIPLPFSLNSITWTGSLTNSGLFSGTFTAPIFTHGNISAFSFTLWNGDFSLQITPVWNSSIASGFTLDSLVTPGTTYSSSVSLQSMDDLSPKFLNSISESSYQTQAVLPSTKPKVPLALLGTFSPDKTSFTWSGKVLLKFPGAMPWYTLKNSMPQSMLQKDSPEKLKAVGPSSYTVIVSATVVSGIITGSSSPGGSKITLFSGSPPLSITLPMKLTGITWTGSLSNSGILRGVYTVPTFTSGNISTFSVTTWNGEFSFNIVQTWNTSFAPGVTMDSLIYPGITYTTSIYMQEAAKVTETFLKAFNDPDMDTLTTAFSIGEKLSVVLIGTFSPDKTSFIWSGDVLMKIPTTNPWIPFPKPMSNSPMLQKISPDMLKAVGSSSYTVIVSATVISGMITGSSSSGGSKMTLFSGSPPLSITLPMKLTGITWTGSLSSSGILRGTYTVPIFTNGNISTFSFTNWNGEFSFNIMQTWNTSFAPGVTMDSLISPGITYTTSIYMQEAAKVTETFLKTLNEPDIETLTIPFSIGKKVSVVLIGTFSPDKTSFMWSGNVLMKIPTTNPWIPFPKPIPQSPMIQKNSPDMLMAVGSTTYRVMMSATVISGMITGSSSPAGSKVTLFSGTPPIRITLPLKLTGITWTGSLSNSGMLKGVYTMPTFTHGNISTFSVTTWSGEFSFHIMQTWNSSFAPGVTMDSLISPSTTYTTSVYMQEAAKVNETLLKTLNEPDIEELTTAYSIGEKVSVILIGIFSPDKTSFTWSGDVVMKISTVNPWIPFPNTVPQSLILMKSFSQKTLQKAMVTSSYSVSMGVKVISGTVTASTSASGGKITLFSGSLPVSIELPLPLTDITWSGSLSSSGMLSGMFSLPIFKHGNISVFSSTVWNGEFNLQITQTWNSSVSSGLTMDSLITPGMTYVSSIYMQPTGKVTKEFLKSLSEPTLAELATSSSKSAKVPIVLVGTFAPGKTSFMWSGDMIVKLPTTNPWVPTPKPKPQMEATKPVKAISQQIQSDILGSSKSSVTLGATVISGTITGSNALGGPKVTLFSGSPPLNIAVPMALTSITWSGSLSNSGSLKGTFTAPIFKHGNISTFSLTTWTGEFDLQISQLWNSSFSSGLTMESLISPGMTYTTSIFMQSATKITEGFLKSLSEPDLEESTTSSSKAVKVPVILVGTFSPDKANFIWSGSMIIKFPVAKAWIPPPKPMSLEGIFPNSLVSSRVTATVLSGSVSAASAGNFPFSWWSGSPPVTIHFPAGGQKSYTATWNGSLISDPVSGSSVLRGVFSLPIFTHGNLSIFSAALWTGEFTFKLQTLLPLPVNALVTPGTQYISRIIFQGTTPMLYPTEQLEESAFSALNNVPITLQGIYSPDRLSFTWSGSVIISFPRPFVTKPPVAIAEPPTTLIKPKEPSLGVKIVSGSILAKSTNSDSAVTLFDGSPPVNLPLPLSLYDITCNGSLSESGSLKGYFEVPIFNNSDLSVSSVIWSGDFELQLAVLWNSTMTLSSLINPMMTYSVGVYLQSSTSFSVGETLFSTYSSSKYLELKSNLLAENGKSSATLPKISVILQGTYSPDKTSFLWSGEAIMVFPSTVAPALQAGPDISRKPLSSDALFAFKLGSGHTVVAATVAWGSISAAADGSSPTPWWNGGAPVSISLSGMNKYGRVAYGIKWSGSMTSDGFGGAVMRGIFTLPLIHHGNITEFSVQIWNGQFTMQMRLYSDILGLDSLVTSEKTFSSSVYLHHGDHPLNTVDTLMVASPEKPSSNTYRVPIILMGSYSPDGSVYTWNGDIFMAFPSMQSNKV